jgi:hypothetical protein
MRSFGWDPTLVRVLAVLIGLVPTLAGAEGPAGDPGDYVQSFGPQGEVNWMSGFLTAKGIGVASTSAVNGGQRRAQAFTAAETLARRNLLAIIKGVHLDSTTNVDGAMLVSDLVNKRVTGFLQGAQVIDSKVLPDGSAEVTVAIRAIGPLADLVLPAQHSPRPAPPVAMPPAPPAPPTPSTPPPSPMVAPVPPKPEIFTGLVVDARGLNLRPAISPKLISASGQEIYGSAVVDREWAVREGMAGYAKDLLAAQSSNRVAEKPFVVKAIRATGASKTDVVLSDADAAKLLATAENLSFLERARVMIVVD